MVGKVVAEDEEKGEVDVTAGEDEAEQEVDAKEAKELEEVEDEEKSEEVNEVLRNVPLAELASWLRSSWLPILPHPHAAKKLCGCDCGVIYSFCSLIAQRIRPAC